MMTFDTAKPSDCGIVEIDKNNIVTKYEEKPKFSKLTRANGAIFILSRDFLKNFSKDKKDKDFVKIFYQNIFTRFKHTILIRNFLILVQRKY